MDGYSVGRWDGDDRVVEMRGFNDQSWLDGAGHPHSDQMRVTERYTRRSVGQMEVSVTIDDPVAHTRPLTYVQRLWLRPDTELIEYVCEDAKEIGRGRNQQGVRERRATQPGGMHRRPRWRPYSRSSP